MTDFFLEHFWAAPLLWGALYISDYRMTLICARLYQAGVHEKMTFEGSYEITPFYQKDIDTLRRLSPRFVTVLAIGVVTFSRMCGLVSTNRPSPWPRTRV